MKLNHLRHFFAWSMSDESPYFVFGAMFVFYAACVCITVLVTLASLAKGYWIVPIIMFFIVPLTIAYVAYRKLNKGGPS